MALKDNLSENIRALRKLHNSSLEEFASEIGISKSSLQTIEKGQDLNPSLGTIETISKSLEVPALSLLSDTYNTDELHIAFILLRTISRVVNLPDDKQQQASNLFDQLIRLLSSTSEKQGETKEEPSCEHLISSMETGD